MNAEEARALTHTASNCECFEHFEKEWLDHIAKCAAKGSHQALKYLDPRYEHWKDQLMESLRGRGFVPRDHVMGMILISWN